MKSVAVIVSLVILLTGCSVHKKMVPVSGSKADGTIEMGYTFGWLETPEVNQEEARRLAGEKCRVWGYDDAEPFGGQMSNCVERNGYGNCLKTDVRVSFQCTGGKAAKY